MQYWIIFIIVLFITFIAVELYVKIKTGRWLSYYMIVHAQENPKQTYFIIGITMFIIGAIFGHLFL